MVRVNSVLLFFAPMVVLSASAAIPSPGAANLEPAMTATMDSIPVWISGNGTGNHWLVWRIYAPKVTVLGDFVVNGFGGNSRIMVAYYDSEYHFRSSSSLSDWRNYRSGVFVNGTLPVLGPVQVDLRGPDKQYKINDPVSISVTINHPDVDVAEWENFTGYFLIAILGSYESYSWELRNGTGSDVVVEEGAEGYLLRKDDFPNTFGAQAHQDLSAVANNWRVGASAVYNASIQLTFDRVFIGGFEDGVGSAHWMSVDTPEGFKIVSGPTRNNIGTGWAYRWLYLVEDPAGNNPLSKWVNPDRESLHGSNWDRGTPGTYTFNATGPGAHARLVTDDIVLWAVVPRFPGLDTSK